MDVGDHPGARAAHARQRRCACRHHNVAGKHQVSACLDHPGRTQLARIAGDADVAGHRAVLLRQPGEVQRGDRLALEVRGHAQNRADRDHSSTANARGEDVVGLD